MKEERRRLLFDYLNNPRKERQKIIKKMLEHELEKAMIENKHDTIMEITNIMIALQLYKQDKSIIIQG